MFDNKTDNIRDVHIVYEEEDADAMFPVLIFELPICISKLQLLKF